MSDGQVTFATLGKAVGFVLQIDGGVRAQSIDGQERPLKVGDPVFYGETVVSAGSGSAVIEFIDGNHIVIGNKSIVELTDEVFTEKESEELVAEAAAEAEALREAIIAGLDPTQIQEAPAAGETSSEQGIATDVDVTRDNTFSLPEYGYDTDNAFPEDEGTTREIEANADQTADDGGDLAVGVGGANVGFVNAIEASSVSGTLTGVDADVVAITVTYSDGTNQIAVAATQAGGVWSTGATDISSLTDGTINVTAVVTDATGNVATVGDTFTLDTVAFTGTVIVDAVTADDVINATEASGAISVTGTATGGDISSGDTVTLVINGTTYTTIVAGDNTWAVDVAGSDLAADTAFDAVVSSSDAAGNTVSSTGSSTHTLDSSALQVNLDIDPITDDSILNATEVAADVVVTGNVTGDAFDSGVVTLTVNGTNYTGNLVNGAFAISVPGSVLSVDSDTTVDASVVVTNSIGQEGTADSTEKYFVDTSARATIRVDSITSDDIIDASESQSTVSVTGRVGFDAQAGDTVTLEINGTTYTTTVQANKTWSVDVAGSDLAQDSSFQASVSGQDSAGNAYTGTTTSTHIVKFEALASFTSTSVTEDDASVSFVVTLNNAAQTDVTITTNHGNIIIAAGETTGTLVVDTQDSDVYLDASTITATISAVVGGNFANLDLSSASTTAQITDTTDTTTVSLSATGSITEAGGTVTYTATLTNAAQGDVTVTLDNGETITIADGATTGTVNVTVAADEDVYTDASSISASITGATGGNFENLAVDSTAATTAITDTTDTTTVSLATSDVNDDAENVTFTATLSNATEIEVTITTDQGDIVIAAGETTGSLDVDLDETDVTAGSISASVISFVGGNFEDVDYSGATVTAEIFDITPTSAPGVVITEDVNNDGLINAAELDGEINVTVSLTDTGAVAGDTLTVNGTDIVLTAADISADQVLTSVTPPAEGTNLVVIAVITDVAGNVSEQGSDSALLDTIAVAGTVTINAITSDDVINETESGKTIAVTGTATGGDIAENDVVTLVINGETYTTTVDENGEWSVDVAGSDLENDTAFDAVVSSSDAAGNTVDTTGSSTHTVDTIAVGQIDIDAITTDGIINSSESATGVLVPITGYVGNDAEPGDIVTITLDGVEIGSAAVSSDQNESGNYLYTVEVLGSALANTSLSNPTIIATVTGTDDAGNEFSATSSEVYQVDLFADVDVFVEDNNTSDSDNIVNFDEQGNMLIGGFFEQGGTVNSITITDSQGNEVTIASGDIMVDQDYFEVTADVAALLDGTLSVVVNVTDPAGNTEDSFTETIVKDTVADAGVVSVNSITSDDVINATESGETIAVSGTASGGDISAGDSVTMTINGQDYSTTVDQNGNWTVDVSGGDLAADTEFDVVVSSSDTAGNTVDSTGTSTHTVDTSATAGSVAVNSITSDDVINATESGQTIAVSGTASGGDIATGDTVTMTINGQDYSTTVDQNGNWTVDVAGSDLADDTEFDVVVSSSDAAGNTVDSTGTSTHTVDTSATAGSVAVNSITSDDVINATESGETIAVSGTASGGDISAGDSVTMTINGQSYSTTVDQNGNWTVDVAGSDLAADTEFDVVVSSSDAAGNTVDSTGTSTHTVDTSATAGSVAVNSITSDDVINATESGETIAVSGTASGGDIATGDTVTMTINGQSYSTTVDQNGNWTVDVAGGDLAADTEFDVVVSSSDSAGNTVDSTGSSTHTVDTSATAGSVAVNSITSDDVINATESDETITVSGTASGGDIATGDTVTMTINGQEYSTTVDQNGNWTVDVAGGDLAADTEFDVVVSSSDAAGNTVDSIGSSIHTVDTSADDDNNFSVTVAASDEETDESEVAHVSVSLSGVDNDADSVVVTFTDLNNVSVTATATIVGGVWTVPDTDLSGLTDGTIDVTALVTDDAGNTSTATDSLELDTSNSAPIITSLSDTNVSEEGLANANADTSGNSDTTNSASVTSTFSVSDVENDNLTVTLSEPADAMTSNGVAIVWSGDGSATLIGTAAGVEVIRIVATDPDVNGNASYTTTLSGPVDHDDTTQEDELSFNLDIVVSDGTNDTTETVSVTIEDDSPDAVTSSANLTLTGVDTIVVKNFEAGFSDTTYAPDENEVTETDNDSDALIDSIAWGTGDSGASSLSMTDDSAITSNSGSNVESGESFDLLNFSHINTAVSSGTSSLESADLDVTFDLEINGTTTAVTIALAIAHDATSNSGSNTDDTVTITTQSVDVVVYGQTYTVVIEGFTDSNDNTVTTISTAEGATGNYALTAHIDAPAQNQSVSGTLDLDAGADGGSVVAATTTDGNGTLVINGDGTYTFTASNALITQVESSGAQTLTYSYTVVDNDGDTVVNTLSIDVENDVVTVADSYSSSEDAVVSVDAAQGVLANDITDSVISVSTFSVDGQAANAGDTVTINNVGDIVINADGSYSFTPVEDWSGDVPQITYTTNTGDTSTLDIDVSAVADIPTLTVTLGDASSESTTLTSSNVSDLGLNTSSEVTQTRTLDFGVENAGQTVTLSFDSLISGGWESSGTYADSYEVSANGTLLESFVYSQSDSASQSQSNSYSVVLNSNGQVSVEFTVDSTGSNEEVDVSNIQATLDSSSSVRDLTITAAQTDNDGSETLTYSIAALPTGVSLLGSDGNVISANQDGSYSLTESQISGLQLDTGEVTDSFDISVSVSSSEGGTSESVTQTVNVEGTSTTIAGLSGQYFAYDDSTNGNLSDIADAMSVVNSNSSTATFTATEISYNYGSGDLGRGTNLENFLGSDAASLSTNPSTETGDAVVYMAGDVSLDAGTYSIKVYADDGYQIVVDGVVVASADFNQSPTTRTETFTIAADGEHSIEIVYWDQGGAYVLDVQLSDDGGATYNSLGGNEYPTTHTTTSGVSADGSVAFVETVASLDESIAAFTQDSASYGQNGTNQSVTDDWKSNTVYGDGNNNIIDSGSKADAVYGQGGDDHISGQSGSDYIDGGAGNDYIDGGSQNDSLYGGDDNDHLIGQSGNDLLSGDDGDDWLEGGSNNDELYGGDGSDLLEGGTGNDELYGGDGSDLLYGGENNDTLLGDAGNDLLIGDGGNDTLSGGADDDRLVGGSGNDTLTGGTGADMFILEDTSDTITDFNAGEDSLDITELLEGLSDAPGSDASTDAIAEFLSSHVSVTDGAVKVDGSDVASFGNSSDFDSNNSGSVDSSDSVSIIYNDQEYTINIDG